jgi:MoxR-like ATPase
MGAKALALIKERVNVSFEDVNQIMFSALNHRIVLSFEAEAERRNSNSILQELTQPIRKDSAGAS